MSTQSDLKAIRDVVSDVQDNPVAKFSYTDAAFNNDIIDGVDTFDVTAEQNIPNPSKTDYNDTVLNKGVRSQAASIPRNAFNHFIGRMSYNLNKLVQKFYAFMNADIASRAHNANEYDASASYIVGDVCYTISNSGALYTKSYFRRIGTGETTGVAVTNTTYWKQLMPKDIGYHRAYTIADLTSGYDTSTYYPVFTALQDFQAQISVAKDPALRVEIEAFCNGTVAGLTNAQRAELRVLAKLTGFAATSTDILVDNSCIDQVNGTDNTANTPIRYTKLPKGRQVVIWLKGGSKYALWNSFGSVMTLYTSTYSNGVDASIAPSASVSTVLNLAKVMVNVEQVGGIAAERIPYGDNLRAATQVTNSNNITKSGWYYSTDAVNNPKGASCLINHAQQADVDTYAWQIAVVRGERGLTFTRQKINGTWTPWDRLDNFSEPSSVSTSSRILDLTGDRVPAIPDDPAGVTYFQDAWATTDGWSNLGESSTVTVSSGKLVGTRVATSGDVNIKKSIVATGKLFIVRVVTSYTGAARISTLVGSTETFKAYNVVAGVEQTFSILAPTCDGVMVKGVAVPVNGTISVDWVYIGTGAYLSKLIDRAGVPWTNYGALPVDGPFGKGLQFNGAQYLQAPGPMIGTTGTIAVSLAPSSFAVDQRFLGNRTATTGMGSFIASNRATSMHFRKADGGIQEIQFGLSTLNTPNVLILTYTTTTMKAYRDGVLVATLALTEPPRISTNNLFVGAQADDSVLRFNGTIYALRADSRVWTDEEIARWSRDPYSEESIPMSSTPSTHSLALRDDAGRMQAASGSASLDVVNKGQLDTKVSKAGDSMTGNLAMGGNKVTGLAASSSNGDAVRHEQLTALDSAVMKTSDLGSGWTTALANPAVTIPSVTSDPASPVNGQMWLRSDL